MKIIPISVEEILPRIEEDKIIQKLGMIAGVAYQSEIRTPRGRLQHCMQKGHDSILEHHSITMSIVTDIGTAKALVRHRHTALTQESTIYCDYSNGRFDGQWQVVAPISEEDENIIGNLERAYMNDTRPAKQKRDLIPHCLKTELVITTNIREWRYILGLRTDPADSGRMHTTIECLHNYLKTKYPFFFEEIPQLWK